MKNFIVKNALWIVVCVVGVAAFLFMRKKGAAAAVSDQYAGILGDAVNTGIVNPKHLTDEQLQINLPPSLDDHLFNNGYGLPVLIKDGTSGGLVYAPIKVENPSSLWAGGTVLTGTKDSPINN